MTKEKILKLLSTEKSEKKIAKKLIKWIKKDSGLLENIFLYNSTIFHTLILKKKFYVLEALLENEAWHEQALSRDRDRSTILHYVIRQDSDAEQTLDLILNCLPGIVNIQNNSGNTALHEAVLQKKLWAVLRLVKAPEIERDLPNFNDKTVFDLAKGSPELKQALLYLNVTSIRTLDLRFRSNSHGSNHSDSVDILHDTFPTFTSFSQSNSPQSLSSSPESYRASFDFEGIRKLEKGASYLTEVEPATDNQDKTLHKDRIIQLLQQLINAYDSGKSSRQYNRLHKEFCELCYKHSFTAHFKLNKLVATSTEIQAVVFKILDNLYADVDEFYIDSQNKISDLLKNFAYIIIQNNTEVDSTPIILPDIKPEHIDRSENLKKIWLLTACQESSRARREFNVEALKHRALGLLSAMPLRQILIHLRILYPQFDRYQKVVANFIVMQLLFYAFTDKVTLDTSARRQLRFFVKLNVSEQFGLGELGETINDNLEQLLASCDLFSNHPLLRNFYLLNKKVNDIDCEGGNSFDDLVNKALMLPAHEREKEVSLIAHELRMLTMNFYQNVELSEFSGCKWQKEDKKILAAHLVDATDNFNKLSDYFVEKILEQPADRVTNALQLLLELAQMICPLDGERYPDLNHAMLIATILNNFNISRLSSAFNSLPSQDKTLLNEFTRLASLNENSKYMRNVYQVYRTTLPFLGHLLSDIVAANEGHQSTLGSVEALGAILTEIMEIKLLVNFEKTTYQTNLCAFLNEYTQSDEEQLYYASLRHNPSYINRMALDTSAHDLESFIKDLNNKFLDNHLLPAVLINNQLCKPDKLINEVIRLFANHLQQAESDGVNQFRSLKLTFSALKKTIYKIIKVNNEYYYPKKLSNDKINPQLIKDELEKLQDKHPLLQMSSKSPGEKEKGPDKQDAQSKHKLIRRKKSINFRKSAYFKSSPLFFNKSQSSNDNPVDNNQRNYIRKRSKTAAPVYRPSNPDGK